MICKSVLELREMFEDLITPTILIVDDKPDTLAIVQHDLSNCNVHILSAQNGGEAIDLMQQFHIDLMFLDLLMPILNGYEVLEWMDMHDIEIRTVVLSGDPTNPLILKALKLGPVLLMQKPWTAKIFRKVLNYVPFAKAEYAPAS